MLATWQVWLRAGLAILGALSTILTAVGALGPSSYPLTLWCARFGADVRNRRSK